MQQNQKNLLWGDRNETINHIISEYRKLIQKEYKIWHDWVGKWSAWNCARNLNLALLPTWYEENGTRFAEWDTQSAQIFWETNISPIPD